MPQGELHEVSSCGDWCTPLGRVIASVERVWVSPHCICDLLPARRPGPVEHEESRRRRVPQRVRSVDGRTPLIRSKGAVGWDAYELVLTTMRLWQFRDRATADAPDRMQLIQRSPQRGSQARALDMDLSRLPRSGAPDAGAARLSRSERYSGMRQTSVRETLPNTGAGECERSISVDDLDAACLTPPGSHTSPSR